MNTWDRLAPADMRAFRTTLRNWLDLGICSTNKLGARAGCSSATVPRIISGRSWTTHQTANEIMQAIGQIERAYIKQWRDRQVQNESH